MEFFLFSKSGDQIDPLPHDRGGYFDLSTDLASTVRKDMVVALEQILHQALVIFDEAIAPEGQTLDMVSSSFGVEYKARVWKTPLPVGTVKSRNFYAIRALRPASENRAQERRERV